MCAFVEKVEVHWRDGVSLQVQPEKPEAEGAHSLSVLKILWTIDFGS